MKQHLITYPSDVQEDPGFALTKNEISAGTVYPIHWHDFFEFEIIVSGQGEHIYNGSVYTIASGCAYLMCYNDFHGLSATSDITLYSIHFSRSLLPSELADFLEFNKFRCRFTSAETEGIVQKLLAMEDESKNSLPFRDNIIRNLIADILILAIRKSTNEKIHTTPPPIRKAVAYINTNFREVLTLEKLAAEICFSPNYLGQLFKTETGVTFNEYVNSLRLKYACSLLVFSNLTIKEIAFSAGYRSVEYFLYIFKKKLRMTPSQYRESHNRGS